MSEPMYTVIKREAGQPFQVVIAVANLDRAWKAAYRMAKEHDVKYTVERHLGQGHYEVVASFEKEKKAA